MDGNTDIYQERTAQVAVGLFVSALISNLGLRKSEFANACNLSKSQQTALNKVLSGDRKIDQDQAELFSNYFEWDGESFSVEHWLTLANFPEKIPPQFKYKNYPNSIEKSHSKLQENIAAANATMQLSHPQNKKEDEKEIVTSEHKDKEQKTRPEATEAFSATNKSVSLETQAGSKMTFEFNGNARELGEFIREFEQGYSDPEI